MLGSVMATPQDLESQMAARTDEQLLEVVARPMDWIPEAIAAANTELQRRGIAVPTSTLDDATLTTPPASELPENLEFLTSLGIGGGLLLQVMSGIFQLIDDPSAFFLSVMGRVMGTILLVWGCKNFAVGKGYSKWFGALGMLSCLGPIVLLLLPDRRKKFDDQATERQ
jgi:hypothetical protein